MSYISADVGISDPRHANTWRDKDGTIWATVRDGKATLFFDSAGDARAQAAACTAAADAMDRLAAEASS